MTSDTQHPIGKRPFRLRPGLQHYVWGDTALLSELLGLEAAQEEPLAEAWYGAHPARPARAQLDSEELALDRLIARRTRSILGDEVAEQYGQLPYLLKVLAVRRPLSVQVHPNAEEARAGYRREHESGIPIDAPERCYRDESAKPELVVAVTDFRALCGFRPAAEVRQQLARIPEIRDILPAFDPSTEGLERLVGAYFELPDAEVGKASRRLLLRLREAHSRRPFAHSDPALWLLEAFEGVSGDVVDRGVLWVFLLNLVHLSAGQAMYLPPGTPHTYLRGAAVEIMASSDNVIRCGLTTKHVNSDEMLRIVDFGATNPSLCAHAPSGRRAEAAFRSPAKEFELRVVERGPQPDRFDAVSEGPETILNLSPDRAGEVVVQSDQGDLALGHGEACLVPHGSRYSLRTTGPVRVFRVTRPKPEWPQGGAGGTDDVGASFRGREPVRLAFGTSGLRGLVADITDLEAYVNTRGFLAYLLSRGDARDPVPVVLAGDLRPSTHSPERSILCAVARAVEDAGLEVVYAGRIPAPALMSFSLARGWPSIMVTGSHIPFDRNGIKFNKSTGEVLKTDELPILDAVEQVRREEYSKPASESVFDDEGMLLPAAKPCLPPVNETVRKDYVNRYLDFFPPDALRGKRVVLYEHSAVGRDVVAEILLGLGAEVHAVGRVEGFVAIDTEAISEETLGQIQELADAARERFGTLDAVVSTDGDSDRPMLFGIDPDGAIRFVPGDVLGVVVADYLEADGIALPISASDLVDMHFAPKGVRTRRTRVGSPWLIAAMMEMSGKRRVAWEANGGFLTGSAIELDGRSLNPLPTRDAVLPIVAALHAATKADLSIGELVGRLPNRFGRSGLLDRISRKDSDAIVDLLSPEHSIQECTFQDGVVIWADHDGVEGEAGVELSAELKGLRDRLSRYFGTEHGFAPVLRIDFRDGVRISFANGDVAHIRPSGNAPQLRVYALADSEDRAEEIVQLALREPHGILRQLQIAAGRA